jgi:hypothetical protein
MHPRDEDAYKVDTVVRLKKTGQFAVIKRVAFMMDGKGFLHYLGVIEGRGDGLYALYHSDIDLECLPEQLSHEARQDQRQ